MIARRSAGALMLPHDASLAVREKQISVRRWSR